jgi:alkylhydroperoxidase family enzyme
LLLATRRFATRFNVGAQMLPALVHWISVPKLDDLPFRLEKSVEFARSLCRRRIPKAIAPAPADFATACATAEECNRTVRQHSSRIDVRVTAWITRSAGEATDASRKWRLNRTDRPGSKVEESLAKGVRVTRMPLANADEQPEHVRDLLTRPDTLNVLRLIANAPNVFESWSQMAGRLFDSPTFTPRMREVIILRVGHLQDSPYELAQHVIFARNAGLTDQQIDALQNKNNLDAAGFSADERLVIDTVTELCTTRCLSDDSFAAAYGMLGDEALTELLMIVSCYYGLALVLNAVDLDIDAPA